MKSPLEEFELRYVRPNPGRALVVGSCVYGGKEDRRLRYRDVVGIDMLEGPGVDLVLDLEEPLPDGLGLFDHVECMSVLEHSRRPWLLAQNIERLMKPEATIYVTVPWIWRFHAYDHDFYRFSKDGLFALFGDIDWAHLSYVSDKIMKGNTVRSVTVNGHPYMARTETVGFGVKR